MRDTTVRVKCCQYIAFQASGRFGELILLPAFWGLKQHLQYRYHELY